MRAHFGWNPEAVREHAAWHSGTASGVRTLVDGFPGVLPPANFPQPSG